MSYVLATPEMVAAAANNLAQIGSTLSAANAAALAPTTGVLAAGADEVSAAVASLFSGHAQAYQTLGTQAAAFHERFIQALSTAAGAYGSAEAANASPLQQALNVINAPTQTLLGRPLIGNGTNGAPGTGQAGGPGGLLYGNGGNGGSGGAPIPNNPAAPPAPPTCPTAPAAPLPPLPNNNPPAPPGCPGAVPCAPSPISGRPSSVWVGAFTAPSTTRIAAALAISVAVYHLAAAVSVCTNWS